MKKILLFIITLIVLSEVRSQVVVPPGYSGRNSRENILASAMNALNVPAGDNATLKIGQWVRAGGFYLDTTGSNKGLYYYMDGGWIRVRDTLHDGSGGGGDGISEVIAGYGLTQINDSTFQFSTALRDSIIGLIPGGASINLSDSFTTYCPVKLDTISLRTLIETANPSDYNGFPSLTKTMLDTLLGGNYNATTHTVDSTSQLHLWRSSDYGQTWRDSIFEGDLDSNYRSIQFKSFFQDDKTQLADTIFANYWTIYGNVYWRISTDNGNNWSARTHLATGRKTATEGKAVKFKGKWIVPIYSFSPSATDGGVAYTSDQGATWTIVWFSDAVAVTQNEISLQIKGDSIIAFIRTETPANTMFRAASANGITWTAPVAISVPLYLGGKPETYLMPDGRILLNTRSREVVNVVPDDGRVWISTDGGLTFTEVYQQRYDFNYGAIEYIGGNKYINWYSGIRTGSGGAQIYQTYWEIPPCEILIDNRLVNYSGDPLAGLALTTAIESVTALIPETPGANNDILLSDGNGEAKILSGLNVSGSKLNSPYVVNVNPSGLSNAQIFANASTASATGSLAGGPGADATASFAHVLSSQGIVSAQGGIGFGYSVDVSGTYGIGIGYNVTVPFTESIGLGRNVATTAANQLMIGGTSGINTVIVGNMDTDGNPRDVLWRATNATGTDIPGGNITWRPGRSTGAARGGYFSVETAGIGSTGATLNTAVDRFRIHGDSVEVKTNLFLNRTTVGDADDSILVKGADKKVYTISQNDFAASVNDTITILTPTTGHQLAVEIAPDTLFIKSLVAGSGVTLTDNGDSTITIDATGGSAPTLNATRVAYGGPDNAIHGSDSVTFNGGVLAVYNAGTWGRLDIGQVLMQEVAGVSTPSAGLGFLYGKDDGKIYYKNDAGTDYDLTGAGGGDGGVLYIGKMNNVSKSVKGANIVLDSLILQSADELYSGLATTNQVTSSLGLNVDGQGGVVTTGSKGFITIPYNCTILNWFVSANVSGSIQFDIKRSGTSIVGGGGNKPLLSSAISGNAAVSGWTSVLVTEGDILEWVVDSATTIGNATVTLKVIKL